MKFRSQYLIVRERSNPWNIILFDFWVEED